MTFQPKLTPLQVAALVTDIANGATKITVAEKYGISIRTVFRLLTLPPVKPGPEPKKKLKPCGTNAAYTRHRRNKEYPCTACLQAHAKNVKGKK